MLVVVNAYILGPCAVVTTLWEVVVFIKETRLMEAIMDNLKGYKVWSKVIKELTNTGMPQVEISLAFSDEDDFEHEGFYNNIDEAIEALERIKELYCNN